MLEFGTIPTSKFLYLITNHAIDAIKAIVHMNLRKLKENVRNTEKTW